MSHAAMNDEVLYWLLSGLAGLVGLLVMFVGVVVKTPAETDDAADRPERAGYQPRHAGSGRTEPLVPGRRRTPGGPPWSPAPAPGAPTPRAPTPRAVALNAVPRPRGPVLAPGAHREAHRQVTRPGVHRARMSAGPARRPAAPAGRHRAGAY